MEYEKVPQSELAKELVRNEEASSVKEAKLLTRKIGEVEKTNPNNELFYLSLTGLIASTAAYVYGTLSGEYMDLNGVVALHPGPVGLKAIGKVNALSTLFFLITTPASGLLKELIEPNPKVKVNKAIYGEEPSPESVVEKWSKIRNEVQKEVKEILEEPGE